MQRPGTAPLADGVLTGGVLTDGVLTGGVLTGDEVEGLPTLDSGVEVVVPRVPPFPEQEARTRIDAATSTITVGRSRPPDTLGLVMATKVAIAASDATFLPRTNDTRLVHTRVVATG